MWSLLTRDPSVRSLGRWLLVAPLTASALEGVRTLRAFKAAVAGEGTPFGDTLLIALILWLPLSVFLLFGRTGQRCRRLDLSLPITAHSLWRAHLVGVTGSALVVLLASAAVVAIRDRLVAGLPGRPPMPEAGLSALVLPVLATLFLAVVVLQSPDPSLYKIRATRSNSLFAAVAVLGGLGLVLALGALPAVWSLAALAAAVLLGLRLHSTLPSIFALIPREALSEASTVAEEPQGRSTAGSANRTIGAILLMGIAPGQMLKIPVTVLSFPLLFAWGLLLSGLFFGDADLQFLLVIISAYLLLAFLAAPLAQLHHLDPLPISRRRLFAFLVLPLLATVGLGYFAGRVGVTVKGETTELITIGQLDSRDPDSRTVVRVPLEYWRVAWDGRPPELRAPWGEAHPARTLAPVKGSSILLYSPFSSAEEASVEFMAHQLSRAIDTVYDGSVPPGEVRSRYLEVRGNGSVAPKQEKGLTLLADYPNLRPRKSVSVFPVVFSLIGVLFFLLVAIYMRTFRAAITDRVRKIVFFGLLGVTLTAHVLQFAADMAGFMNPFLLGGVVRILTRQASETLPGGGITTWVVCALVALAGYGLAQSQFGRIEVPLPCAKQDV